MPSNYIQSATALLEILEYKYIDFIAPFSEGLQLEFKVDDKEANVTFETTGCGLLLCPTKLFSSWMEFDDLTVQELIIKVNEFFKYED